MGCSVDRSPLGPADSGRTRTGCATDEDCGDGISCTADVCRERECIHLPEDEACGEQEECTLEGCVRLPCDPSRCELGPCETATCEGDVCVVRPGCSASECCVEGACLNCDDGNSCTEDICSEREGGRCEYVATGAGGDCETGDFCELGECRGRSCEVVGERCSGELVCNPDDRVCVGCRSSSDCPDEEVTPFGPCEFDAFCDSEGTKSRTVTTYDCAGDTCVSTARIDVVACTRPDRDGTSCGFSMTDPWSGCEFDGECAELTDDEIQEMRNEVCQRGECVVVRTTATRSCSRDTDGRACAPMDRCAMTAACTDGTCEATAMVACPDLTPSDCTAPACDPATGACVPAPVADGLPCSLADRCMAGGTCTAGVCGGGTPMDCDDDNVCTADACSDGVCVYEARDGAACGGPGCAARTCVGSTCGERVGCSPSEEVCHISTCDEVSGECDSAEAEDGAPCRICGVESRCDGGECYDSCPDSCTAPGGGDCDSCGCDEEAGACGCLDGPD